jgi:hypothetical protein
MNSNLIGDAFPFSDDSDDSDTASVTSEEESYIEGLFMQDNIDVVYMRDANRDDDVKQLKYYLSKLEFNINDNWPFVGHNMKPLNYATFHGSINCVSWLLSQGAISTKCCHIRDWGKWKDMWCQRQITFDTNGCEMEKKVVSFEQFDDENPLDFYRLKFTPRQIANFIYLRDSEVSRLFDRKQLLRRGFDKLYYRALRLAYAPNAPAAKRARVDFASEF